MESDHRLKIAILTSSRADFGFCLPLLKALKANPEIFTFEIIAFGTHLSPFHGRTIDLILESGFEVKHSIPSMLLSDDEESISVAYALTALRFSSFWAKNKNRFDWVLCLGDRYEMAAAVASGIPFGIRFAHIGGGDTTLGAIDNIYRHTISLASVLHFVLLAPYAKRVKQLVGKNARCVVTGSLSLENLNNITFLSKEEFFKLWGIDLNKTSVLVTLHPETVNSQYNVKHCEETIKALKVLSRDQQLVITMPNVDTAGSVFRQAFEFLEQQYPDRVKLIENFGIQSYFSCMQYADYLIGNTSSGITEAASFGKFVVNIGDRQKGRLTNDNILNVPFNSNDII
jgi:GDP/UDP-N,N'-diacetylbacillosamine 2-epimerase (hydrolysing)